MFHLQRRRILEKGQGTMRTNTLLTAQIEGKAVFLP